GVEILLLAHKRGPAADLHTRRRRSGRQTEDARLPCRRPRHAQQDLHRGRLAGTVPPEESADGTGGNLEVQSTQGLEVVVALPQLACFDDPMLSHGGLPREPAATTLLRKDA